MSFQESSGRPLQTPRTAQRAQQRRRSTDGLWLTDPAAQYTLLPTRDVAEEGPGPERREAATVGERWRGIREAGLEQLDRSEVQILSSLVIMLNAVAIGFETDHPGWFGWEYVENAFLIFFTMELVVRLTLVTPAHYFACHDNPEIIWNLFDFLIVCMGLVDAAATILAPDAANMGFATVFRIIRLCRILRMFRLIRFLKQLYLLAYGFVEAALAIVWVTILMTFVLYVCGIVLARLYGDVPSEDPDYHFLKVHFGTVPGSMLTLFELMSSPDLAMYSSVMANHPSILPFLIAFIIFGSFGMIALLTGVISECMFEKNKAKMDEERQEREAKRNRFQNACQELFRSIDEAGVGSVTNNDLISHKAEIVELLEGAGIQISEKELAQFFNALDTDANGFVDSLEFETGVMQMCEDIRPMSIMELHNSIRKCDMRVDSFTRQFNDRFEDLDSKLEGLVRSVAQIHTALGPKEDGAVAGKRSSERRKTSASSFCSSSSSDSAEAAPSASPEALGAVAEEEENAALLPAAPGAEDAAAQSQAAGLAEKELAALKVRVAAVEAAADSLLAVAPSAPSPPPPFAAAPLPAGAEAMQLGMAKRAGEKGLSEIDGGRLADGRLVFAPARAVLEDFRGHLEEMARQLREEMLLAEWTTGRMGELLARQAAHAARLDSCSSELGKVGAISATSPLAFPGLNGTAPPLEATPEPGGAEGHS